MIQQSVGPRSAGGAVASPASFINAHWKYIVALAIAMIAVVGARSHEVHPILYKIRPALLLSVGGGILAASYTRISVMRRAAADPTFKFAALYFAWALATVPFALWVGAAFKAAQGLFSAIVLLLVILLCPPTAKSLLKIQRGFVMACTFTAMTALAFGVYSNEGRLQTNGSFDPNDLAAVSAMSLPLALGLASRDTLLRRVLWLVAAGILLYTLTRTGSRGGMIAVLVSTTVFVAGQPGSRRLLFAIVCTLGFAASWQAATPEFRQKIVNLINGEQDYNYTEYGGRKQIWARARGYTLAHPVTGVGIGNFPVAEGETCRKNFPDQGCKWSATHNSYLQASAELGFPGVLIFIAMLGTSIKTAYRSYRPRNNPKETTRPELLAAIVGFATSGVFLSHAYFFLLFALMGFIALTAMTRERLMRAAAAGGIPQPVRPPIGTIPRRPFSGTGALRPSGPRPGARISSQQRPLAPQPFVAQMRNGGRSPR